MKDQNINCVAFGELLPDYLEGTLSDSAVADAELHIAACASCRALVDDLRDIMADAAALGPMVPARDLWPEIAERIQPVVTPLVSRPAAARWPRRDWVAGAVAAALAAVAALAVWQARTPDEIVTGPQVVQSVSAVDSASDTTLETPLSGDTTARLVEAIRTSPSALPVSAPRTADAATAYSNEINRLRVIFEEQSDYLDPRTRAILSNSLSTIDSAIAEARAALDRDPASQFLSQQLSRSLEKKLGVLRMAVLLPST